MATDLHALLVEALARLQQALGHGDVDAAVACFAPDGALYGASPEEHAHGADELRGWLAALVARDLAPRWSVAESHNGVEDDEVWFVVDAVLDVEERHGALSHRFRMSGTLCGVRGFYRFRLFNGFEPLQRPTLSLVAS